MPGTVSQNLTLAKLFWCVYITAVNLPQCPNFREGKCERSELRLLGESDASFMFTCACCHLLWAVSKPRTAEAARWTNRVKSIQQATQRERELAARPKVFGRHYGGVKTL